MATIRFSDDDGMDFAVRCLLTGIGYGMAEPGEVLATAAAVVPGDPDSWFTAWTGLGERCEAIAAEASAAGHRQSAAQAYLRAANYRFAGFYYVLASARPDRHRAAWRAHRSCVEAAFDHWATPVERVEVPWEGRALRAWRFRASSDAPAPPTGSGRPLMVVHNGLASPLSDVVMTGVLDAVERGWEAVAFDGPGQGAAVVDDGLAPVDQWERVGSAVLDAVLDRDVDPGAVVVAGIADGGYLAARHAARDPRVAAVVADPGVLRPLDGVLGALPEPLQRAWSDGGATALDAAVDATSDDPDTRFAVAKVVEQWPAHGPGQVLDRLAGWDLELLVDDLRGPVLICDPDDAMSFPGQSAELATRLGDRAVRVPFSTAEGAGLDCEIGAPRLRNQRIFDLLDDWRGLAGPAASPHRKDRP
ncbi:alpha/beta hydrolase family protein [Rhabdothermincola salaria]|uniref:alpha/beta hydrolase family protein n=1 Tax=Rhabdothermincola salaria TaxID=2903142 RepID=UPI001E45E868|nr:alpha/beta hydrolase [Rhabdothermincola salaria]MCD9624348.1 hypothetical protein [Rhabdothermincola salaria]